MLYDDTEQIEVRHVISLSSHDVSIYAGGAEVPDGELWIKRNAIRLTKKWSVGDINSSSKPFYLFSENCSDKEDFYFALLQNQETRPEDSHNPPRPQHFEVKDIISLVQRLHSSEEQLQTRWINALVCRLFLALYKTQEVEDIVRQRITKKIARVKKPAFLSGIVIQKLDMGEAAPHITNPRLKDLTVEGDCCVEADFKYSGNFRLEVGATVRIDLGARFKAREVNLVLAVVIKKLEGHALVRFKPPPSNRVWFTFETMPNMEMTIEPIVSSRQITYNIILRAIESRIREVLAETMVLPHWDDIPFTNTVHQRFRGGIWANDRRKPYLSTVSTNVPDEEAEDEAEGDIETFGSSRFVDDRSQSMPALVDNHHTPTLSRKSTKSTHVLLQSMDEGISSGVEKRSDPPKAMRSQSFASAANPIVSMDNANVDAKKNEGKMKPPKDAASAMIAISNRSQSNSPFEAPVGSISPRAASVSEHSKAESFSSTSSKANSISGSTAMQATKADHLQTSPPSTPISFSSTSVKSAPSTEDQNFTAHNSTARTLTSPVEIRQPIALIGAATATAKKWGWGVLSRNQEQRNGMSATHNPERVGTPERPLGRGRPLPPIGQPLPPPEKRGSLASSISRPKRKPLPPPMLPQRRQDGIKPETAPALPTRRTQQVSLNDVGDAGLMVVEAPPDSEPTSPLDESHNAFIQETEQEAHDHDITLVATDESRLAQLDEQVPFRRPTSSHLSGEYEGDENSLPSWQSAQEQEARSKSIWMNENNEHS